MQSKQTVFSYNGQHILYRHDQDKGTYRLVCEQCCVEGIFSTGDPVHIGQRVDNGDLTYHCCVRVQTSANGSVVMLALPETIEQRNNLAILPVKLVQLPKQQQSWQRVAIGIW